MIMTVNRLKELIDTGSEKDKVLEAKLQALEILIRKYTNNNFQNRSRRIRCDVSSEVGLMCASSLFKVGDTVQLSESAYNSGLYIIDSIDFDNGCMGLNESLIAESDVLVTKVEYPMDVQMGVVNMLSWDLSNRDKVGIQSETISRHSVTYFNMDGDNSTIGYPKSLVGFLKPYMKARF